MLVRVPGTSRSPQREVKEGLTVKVGLESDLADGAPSGQSESWRSLPASGVEIGDNNVLREYCTIYDMDEGYNISIGSIKKLKRIVKRHSKNPIGYFEASSWITLS